MVLAGADVEESLVGRVDWQRIEALGRVVGAAQLALFGDAPGRAVHLLELRAVCMS